MARISYLACFLALCAIAISSFKLVLGVGQQTIENMLTFMIGMLPQMLVLTAGLGNINASVMLFPLLMTASTAFANAINIIVFPLIIMSAILSIVNHMSETIKVDKMAKFFYEMARITLGFFLTLFVGIMTLRALYASVLDKVALRTTRYLSDNAIPVIGKMFSDTIEVAAGYVVMLTGLEYIWGSDTFRLDSYAFNQNSCQSPYIQGSFSYRRTLGRFPYRIHIGKYEYPSFLYAGGSNSSSLDVFYYDCHCSRYV